MKKPGWLVLYSVQRSLPLGKDAGSAKIYAFMAMEPLQSAATAMLRQRSYLSPADMKSERTIGALAQEFHIRSALETERGSAQEVRF